MHNFYNPIQIIRISLIPCSYNSGQFLKFNDKNIFSMTEAKVESLEDHKKKIMQWLKRLSVLERQYAVTIRNKQFCNLIRKMQQENDSLNMKNRYSIHKNQKKQYFLRKSALTYQKEEVANAQQFLLSNLLIMSRSANYDSISLSDTILQNVETIFQLLEKIRLGIIHSYSKEESHAMTQPNNPDYLFYEEEKQNQYKTIAVWIANAIEKVIYVNYYRQQQHQDFDGLHSTKSQIKQYAKIWKETKIDVKAEIIQNGLNTQMQELIQENCKYINILPSEFPSIQKVPLEIINQEIQALINCDEKLFYRHLTETPLQKCNSQFHYLKTQIILEVQNLIRQLQDKETLNKSKLNMKKKKNQKKKHQSHLIVQKQKQSQKQVESSNKQQNQIEKTQKKEETLNIKQYCEGVENMHALGVQNRQKQKKIEVNNGKSLEEPPVILQKFRCKDSSSDSTNDVVEEEQKKCEIIYLDGEDHLDSQINSLVNEIKQDAKIGDRCRKIIYKRICHILMQMNLSCTMYGSAACGLALRTSDLDLSIDPSIVHFFYTDFCSYREKIVLSLSFLQSKLSSMSWVTDFTLLGNASVPLLSFKANPSVYFEHKEHSKMKLNFSKNKLAEMSEPIHVDITIQTYQNIILEVNPHKGLQATELIKSWLLNEPLLQKLVLLCKCLLKMKNLHKSYEGGLSSFALITLIFCFLKHQSLSSKDSSTLYDSFQQLITFIADFDSYNYVIDIHAVHPIVKFYAQNKLIICSPLDRNKILTENCYKFQEIQNYMKTIHALKIHQIRQFIQIK